MSATEGPQLEVVEQEDGSYAIVRVEDGHVLSTHQRRAGADAELYRLAGAGADDADDADEVLTDTQGAHPGNTSD